MQKIDLKRELKHLYQPTAKSVVQVELPTFQFLMIDGQGDPGTSPAYVQAVEALFSVSYAAKVHGEKWGAANRLCCHAAGRPVVVGRYVQLRQKRLI